MMIIRQVLHYWFCLLQELAQRVQSQLGLLVVHKCKLVCAVCINISHRNMDTILTKARTHTHIHARTHITRTRTSCAHAHTTHACTHTVHMHAHTHTHTHTRTHARTHARTHTHTTHLFSQEVSVYVYPLGHKGTHKVLGWFHIHPNPANTDKVI